jgi:hypothetical protein
VRETIYSVFIFVSYGKLSEFRLVLIRCSIKLCIINICLFIVDLENFYISLSFVKWCEEKIGIDIRMAHPFEYEMNVEIGL